MGRKISLSLLVLAAFGCRNEGTSLAESPSDQSVDARNSELLRFVMFAVLEGLYKDGVDAELVKQLVNAPEPGYFVVKCQICAAAKAGFKLYLHHPDEEPFWPSGPKGPGLPKEAHAGLASPDRKVRLNALESLVGKYIHERFEKTRWAPHEERRMEELLLYARKFGMSVKESAFGDHCANCNGATWWEKKK